MSITKPWITEGHGSWLMWEKIFQTWKLDMLFLTMEGQYRFEYGFMYFEFAVTDWEEGDMKVSENGLKLLVNKIISHFQLQLPLEDL